MPARLHAVRFIWLPLFFFRLYGVEIVEGAKSIEEVSFLDATGASQPCAFMLGNEGAGMNAPQLAACDEFIVIPQYGVGTASLNVSNAAAIVLSHFAQRRHDAPPTSRHAH